MYLVDGQPLFKDIKTVAPDVLLKERYSSLILGPTLQDGKRQSEWQQFFLNQGRELPSLPALVAIFMQIKEALHSEDKTLKSAAEELTNSIREDYHHGSLPTSTWVNWGNKTITHRVLTPQAYELPFELPPRFNTDEIKGRYELKELIKIAGYRDALISLMGQKDVVYVYQTLRDVINKEPLLMIYNSEIGELLDSIWFADNYIPGEVKIDSIWWSHKVPTEARSILSDSREAIEQITRQSLEERVLLP